MSKPFPADHPFLNGYFAPLHIEGDAKHLPVSGDLPAVRRIATFSRAAFMAAQIMFAVPTLTCTITAGIRRDTMP